VTLNPFIELARDPVEALAWLGYVLLMFGIVAAAIPWAARQAVVLVVRYQKNAQSDAWWSLGQRRRGYIPPLSWLSRLFAIVFVLAVAAWALGTIVWVIG